MTAPLAVIIGVGDGLSASLARRLSEAGYRLVLAARDTEKLGPLAAQTGAETAALDARDPAAVAALFDGLDAAPRVAIYNPSARVRGPVTELDPAAVERAVRITALGAFFSAREAALRMVPKGHGALLFTGASAGVKGFPDSSSFAMGKFALRGLCQSLARELHPKGIHVGHFVIDGAIRNPERRPEPSEDAHLDPDAIARSYWHFLEQDRSSWAWEIELRPWVERF